MSLNKRIRGMTVGGDTYERFRRALDPALEFAASESALERTWQAICERRSLLDRWRICGGASFLIS